MKISIVFVAVILTGCTGNHSYSSISEREEPLYERGQKYLKTSEHMNAMNAFLKLIEKRRDAPESHLEVGRVYLNQLKDPIAAIYHFTKFLEAKPNVPQSPMVRQMIETAKKTFIQSLPGRSEPGASDRVDLLRLLKQTRNENLKLRKLIAQLQSQIGQKESYTLLNNASNLSESPSFAPISNEQSKRNYPEYYTVKNGDSLSKISQKIYGSAVYWQKIYSANRNLLPTPHSLKVGQVLRVPPQT